MPVALQDYIASLKREVQPPGTDLYASVQTEDWLGYLSDAFWEARLDGFMTGYTTTTHSSTDITIDSTTGGADIERQQLALVILYAGIRVLRNKILNTQTLFRAKAGPVEFEQQSSATMLAEMLRQLRDVKDRIIAEYGVNATHVVVLDAFSTRVFELPSYFGGPELAG